MNPGRGQLNKGNIGRGAPKAENKMSDGINLISSPALKGEKAYCGFLRVVCGEIEVRQNDHLAFTVTVVSGFCYLAGLPPDVVMNIFMVSHKAMQQYFGSDTKSEGKQQ